MQRRFAPGARVTVRDEDWVIRRIDLSDDGGHALTCDGLSELVRGTSAIFLDRLEDAIQVHDPAQTELFQDTSDYFTDSLLYLESQRLRTVANDQHIHRAHQAVMKRADYQRVPAEKGLKQVRTRILIADGVGLGKTLEAAMLATELDIRGRGRRILVVTQKSMLTQFRRSGGPGSPSRWCDSTLRASNASATTSRPGTTPSTTTTRPSSRWTP